MHIPVLREKVLEYLNPQPNENFIDCTIGGGGHALSILEHTAPRGKMLGIDWDEQAIKALAEKIRKRKFQDRAILEHENFAHIKELAKKNKFQSIAGILFDFGLSSDQLESKRGFSFQKDEPLDMRYSEKNPITAEKIVNWSSRAELEQILTDYGEEQFAEQIAHAIIAHRKEKSIQKTLRLARIVEHATPKWYHRKKIHPATKTFQALRIAVNDELNNIKQGLRDAVAILEANGAIAAISFHSLEDRIVKEFFKNTPLLKTLTKKPLAPTNAEVKKNPRARSAKLRVAEKLYNL